MKSIWTAEMAQSLIQSIVMQGNLTEPTEGFPLGKVGDWKAVTEDMSAKGHELTMNSLQAQWSRDARERLSRAKSSTTIPDGTSASDALAIIAGLPIPTPRSSPPAQSTLPPPDDTTAMENFRSEMKALTKQSRVDLLATLTTSVDILCEVMEEGEEELVALLLGD
ncbi:hypothetical protein F4677DRAFT_459643 [Hypoxylon crocopeplum]|nr:hypothetical protein F4677DRAFT_459643 [Hypoxylon crocopeplum]